MVVVGVVVVEVTEGDGDVSGGGGAEGVVVSCRGRLGPFFLRPLVGGGRDLVPNGLERENGKGFCQCS